MNICETVTNRILKQLESGQLPWRKTWTVGLASQARSQRRFRKLAPAESESGIDHGFGPPPLLPWPFPLSLACFPNRRRSAR